MSKNTDVNTKFYNKSTNKKEYVPKIGDIVRVSLNNIDEYKEQNKIKVLSLNLCIKSIKNESLLGEDMYGNKVSFFQNQIKKIVFDSNKQTSIKDFLFNNEVDLLKTNIKEINKKLESVNISFSHRRNLKLLKKKQVEKLNNLEQSKIDISNQSTLNKLEYEQKFLFD